MKNSVTVKRVGSTLVANLPKANPPLVWSLALDRYPNFTLALQGSAGDWHLGLTSFKEDFRTVAHFTDHNDAQDAFNRIQHALMVRPRMRWGGAGWALVIILTVFVAVATGIYGIGTSIINNAGKSLVRHTMPPLSEDGVPQSADDVLKAPY